MASDDLVREVVCAVRAQRVDVGGDLVGLRSQLLDGGLVQPGVLDRRGHRRDRGVRREDLPRTAALEVDTEVEAAYPQ